MKQDETNEISPSRPLPSSDLVPVIDLVWAEAHPESLGGLDIACRNHGFFLLKNHGMDRQIDAMWQKSAAFFRQPSEVKQRTMRTETQPLGYYDRELTKRKRDLKEVFDFREVKTAGRDLNQWPKHDNEFQTGNVIFFYGGVRGRSQNLTGCLSRALSERRHFGIAQRISSDQ